MNTYRIARYIRELRKAAGLTQKQLAEKLNISFQAVSKWENGDTLPDTGILLQLCETLNTTVDMLLNGGAIIAQDEDILHLDDVIRGFEAIEDVGRYFGEDSTFYLGMVEGINQKMNIDILTYLKDQRTREVMYAEVLIQGILSGKKVDMEEIESTFTNRKMVDTIRNYIDKASH